MRYKSCRLLEHGIYFYLDPGSAQLCVGHCCNSDNLELENRLYLYFDLKNETLNWDYIFEEKRKLRENAKKGIYPSQCDGCFELTERDWDNKDYINHVTAGHIMKCNSRCIYCPIGRIPDMHNREQDVDFKPIIEELIKKNLLKYNGSLRFVGGEPTLMKEFDWLVELFSKHNVPEIYVPTSGIRLSKSLCNALKKVEEAAIVTSVDAGCSETFEKIKGTKFYNIVLKNMKTYLENARLKKFIVSKFILVTNYNDTANEVKSWLKNCKNIGLVEVQFDAEHSVSSSEDCENKKYTNRTIKMLKYAKLTAKKYGLRTKCFLAFMNRARRIYKDQKNFYINNKEKYTNLIVENESTQINYDNYYENLYLNIENISTEYINNKIDNLVRQDKFAPKRRAFLTSNSEITNTNNFEEKIMLLLRLGFDLELTTSKIKNNKIIDEIIKTSHSKIIYKAGKVKLFSEIQYLILKIKYFKKIKLGCIFFEN